MPRTPHYHSSVCPLPTVPHTSLTIAQSADISLIPTRPPTSPPYIHVLSTASITLISSILTSYHTLLLRSSDSSRLASSLSTLTLTPPPPPVHHQCGNHPRCGAGAEGVLATLQMIRGQLRTPRRVSWPRPGRTDTCKDSPLWPVNPSSLPRVSHVSPWGLSRVSLGSPKGPRVP